MERGLRRTVSKSSPLRGLATSVRGDDSIMLSAVLVLLCALAVFVTGEVVRGQCRRMLLRPLAAQLGGPDAVSADAYA